MKKSYYPASPLGSLLRVPFAHKSCEIKHMGKTHTVPLSSDLSGLGKGKYKAVKVRLDGRWFHSAKEARRYSKLCFLEKQGIIHDLQVQPPFSIVINEIKIKTVRFDFAYNFQGHRYWEDVKGFKTASFRENWLLVRALYPACRLCIS